MRVTAVGREAIEDALEDMVAFAMAIVELSVGTIEALVELAYRSSVLHMVRKRKDATVRGRTHEEVVVELELVVGGGV